MLQVTEVTTTNAFCSLRDQWNRCLASSGQNTIFLTWEWLFTWWETYGKSDQLRILICSDETGHIVGIAPFYTTSERVFGFPLRTLRLLGSNEACSEYLDIFACPDRTRDVVDAFAIHMKPRMPQLDVLHLLDVPDQALLDSFLAQLQDGARWHRQEWPQTTNLFLTLPATQVAYDEASDCQKRKATLRKIRKLTREHGLSCRTVEGGSMLEAAFDNFVGLHQKLWNDRGLPGMFKRQDFRRFHRVAAQRFSDSGWLRLCFLSSNAMDLAALYGFQYGHKFYYYQSGFDPEWRTYGVGKALLYQTIVDAIRNHLTEYDFLRGTDDYKFDFASTYRNTKELLLTRDRHVLSLYLLRNDLRRRAKGLLKQVLPAELFTRLKHVRDQVVLR